MKCYVVIIKVTTKNTLLNNFCSCFHAYLLLQFVKHGTRKTRKMTTAKLRAEVNWDSAHMRNEEWGDPIQGEPIKSQSQSREDPFQSHSWEAQHGARVWALLKMARPEPELELRWAKAALSWANESQAPRWGSMIKSKLQGKLTGNESQLQLMGVKKR